MKQAERPLVVSGTGCGSEAVLHAAANVAWALCREDRAADLFLVLPEDNSAGLGLLAGRELEDAVQAAKRGEIETVVVLENDLSRRADAASLDALLGAARHVIAIDHLENATTAKAELVLPGATFAEASGTLVNNEGRAQRFYRAFVPRGEVQESWRWLRDIMTSAGRSEMAAWDNLDAIDAALAQEFPVFKPVNEIAPPADYRFDGLRIPRQPHRYSGRTSMHANVNVHEPKPPADPDSPLAFSMEGYEQKPPSPLVTHFWAPGWNSVQSVNKFQSEIAGPLVGGDPGRRLLEPDGEKARFFDQLPPAFKARGDQWLAIPVHHIFGSDELSILSPGIAERAPAPYVGLNAADAQRLGAKDGQEIDFTLGGQVRRLPVRIVPGLPEGVAAIPAGLRGLESLVLPCWLKIGGGRV